MRSIVMGLAICLGVAATAAAQDAKVVKGQELYVSLKCALCHSVAGVGNKLGPMEDIAARVSAKDIRAWLMDPKGMLAKRVPPSTRKPLMLELKWTKVEVDALALKGVTQTVGASKVTPADLDALVAYVQSLKPKS
jgi:mono/diheme cytochrome c family protein